MNLDCATLDGLLVIRVLDERIDATNVQGFRDRVDPQLTGGIARVVVDLTPVDYMDSSGLGAMISLYRRLPAHGTLAVCGMNERIDGLLKATRLNKVFAVFASEEDALTQLTCS